MGNTMQMVETRIEETTGLLGITLREYRQFLGFRCAEHNMSEGAAENGGLDGYLEPDELRDYRKVYSLIMRRNLLSRVNEDVQFRTTYQNGQTGVSPVYPSCPLR